MCPLIDFTSRNNCNAFSFYLAYRSIISAHSMNIDFVLVKHDVGPIMIVLQLTCLPNLAAVLTRNITIGIIRRLISLQISIHLFAR